MLEGEVAKVGDAMRECVVSVGRGAASYGRLFVSFVDPVSCFEVARARTAYFIDILILSIWPVA